MKCQNESILILHRILNFNQVSTFLNVDTTSLCQLGTTTIMVCCISGGPIRPFFDAEDLFSLWLVPSKLVISEGEGTTRFSPRLTENAVKNSWSISGQKYSPNSVALPRYYMIRANKKNQMRKKKLIFTRAFHWVMNSKGPFYEYKERLYFPTRRTSYMHQMPISHHYQLLPGYAVIVKSVERGMGRRICYLRKQELL